MPDAHPLLGPLAELVGTWEGTGTGRLPGQPDFSWQEQLRVATPGTPVLSFQQRTTRPDGTPFHAEDGWVRVPPELQEDQPAGRARVELAVTSPTGILEALSGTLQQADDGVAGFVMEATSAMLARTPAAGRVTETRRRWTWDGEVLVVEFWMATPEHPQPFHHLTAHLHRTHSTS